METVLYSDYVYLGVGEQLQITYIGYMLYLIPEEVLSDFSTIFGVTGAL